MEQMDLIYSGVATLPDLANTFGQKVIAIVRSAITKNMRATQENQYFPRDGKNQAPASL